MTGHAGRIRQAVVILLVAVRALPRGHGMHPRQGEPGSAVIEFGIRPSRCVMTLFASRRETGVRQGAGRAREILLMA